MMRRTQPVNVRTSAEGKQLFNAAELSLSLQNRKGTFVNTNSNNSLQLFMRSFVNAKFQKQEHRFSSEDGG